MYITVMYIAVTLYITVTAEQLPENGAVYLLYITDAVTL